MTYFINLSNHPSSKWSKEQINAAKELGEIIDIPFPNILPESDRNDVIQLAWDYYKSISEKYDPVCNEVTIHIMGEMTFVYNFVNLAGLDCNCVASTTQRITTENPDGTKTSMFKFIQFRSY